MAIHADYPGLTVEIYGDGKPLEEYKNLEEEDVPETTTRYVECRSGAEFAIRTKFTSPFKPMDTSIVAYLDGTKVHSQVAQPPAMLTGVYDQSQHKWKENAALKSLGIVPRSPSPSPIPEPALIKKEASPEPTPNNVPNILSPSATPRPKSASATPAPPQPKFISPTPNEHDGLTDEDIIALIKHYRGNDKGLTGQNRKRLLVLLKHYEDKDNEQVPTKQEADPSESRVRIKREHTDDGAARGQGKKRKPEVIILDD
ncbi:hypothetical protein J4E86_001763 [Alternaria arbusti]|uniref:uncharacterized protein n=1 Tax=Alternaria arbusti TaxID=232088 RepID=UPI00221EB347|nr:uncharacterized protein J4E86_001763 [Alternaria arbusti]KAI4960143.1 hypothetical protein J4E86_001763 [Alternaria arbusti]